jgi:hypothetical protein
MKWNNVTPDQLAQANSLVNVEASLHKGMILHAACFKDNALYVTDIWESVEDYTQFVQNEVMPALAQVGFGQPEAVEMMPIFDLFIPQATQVINRPLNARA